MSQPSKTFFSCMSNREKIEKQIVSNRQKEHDYNQHWSNVYQHFKDSTNKARKQKEWLSQETYNDSMETYQKMKKIEVHQQKLEERRKILRDMLETERISLEAEMNVLHGKKLQTGFSKPSCARDIYVSGLSNMSNLKRHQETLKNKKLLLLDILEKRKSTMHRGKLLHARLSSSKHHHVKLRQMSRQIRSELECDLELLKELSKAGGHDFDQSLNEINWLLQVTTKQLEKENNFENYMDTLERSDVERLWRPKIAEWSHDRKNRHRVIDQAVVFQLAQLSSENSEKKSGFVPSIGPPGTEQQDGEFQVENQDNDQKKRSQIMAKIKEDAKQERLERKENFPVSLSRLSIESPGGPSALSARNRNKNMTRSHAVLPDEDDELTLDLSSNRSSPILPRKRVNPANQNINRHDSISTLSSCHSLPETHFIERKNSNSSPEEHQNTNNKIFWPKSQANPDQSPSQQEESTADLHSSRTTSTPNCDRSNGLSKVNVARHLTKANSTQVRSSRSMLCEHDASRHSSRTTVTSPDVSRPVASEGDAAQQTSASSSTSGVPPRGSCTPLPKVNPITGEESPAFRGLRTPLHDLPNPLGFTGHDWHPNMDFRRKKAAWH